ncbi:hypothetical protein ACFQ60_48075 [Streptomyces zhihengii]
MQGQAAVKTRPPKRRARSLDDLLTDWRRRAIAATDRDIVDNLLATARSAARERPAPAALDIAAAADAVLAAVTERRTTFRRRHVLAEARRYLMRTLAGVTARPGRPSRSPSGSLPTATAWTSPRPRSTRRTRISSARTAPPSTSPSAHRPTPPARCSPPRTGCWPPPAPP